MSQIPKAVSESVLNVAGQTIRVSQLDNGQRVLVADDLEKFFASGIDPQRLADALMIDQLQDDRRKLLKEVELFCDIAMMKSPGTKLGGLDWKGIHERLSKLLTDVKANEALPVSAHLPESPTGCRNQRRSAGISKPPQFDKWRSESSPRRETVIWASHIWIVEGCRGRIRGLA